MYTQKLKLSGFTISTYTGLGWDGEMNKEVCHVASIDTGKRGSGWGLKQHPHHWHVHLPQTLTAAPEKRKTGKYKIDAILDGLVISPVMIQSVSSTNVPLYLWEQPSSLYSAIVSLNSLAKD